MSERNQSNNLAPPMSSAADLLLEGEFAPAGEADRIESQRVFSDFVDMAAVDVPEMAENEVFIKLCGNDLIERFGIMPAFFNDAGPAFVFASVANRWSNSVRGSEEQKFLLSVLTLLAARYSDPLAAAYISTQAGTGENAYSADYLESTIDRYTDSTMTGRLQSEINKGLLDNIYKKLGRSAETAAPFELRVITIGDEAANEGMAAPPPKTATTGTIDGKPVRWTSREADELNAEVAAWQEELLKRNERFSQAMGWRSVGTAWNIELNGRR